MDKISVVTVSYRAEMTIEDTIKSVLNQSYQNFEYILIDGDSDDDTYKIICQYDEMFKCKGIRYFHISEPDKGIYDAMNKALDYCTGDWIIYMNANDTFYANDVLGKIFLTGDDYSGVDCIYGDTWNIYGKKRYYRKSYPIRVITYRVAFIHQALFIRIAIMKEFKFDLLYEVSADYDLFVRLYASGKTFKRVNVIVANYDLNGVSQNNPKEVQREWKTIQKLNGVYKTDRVNRFIYENIVIRCKTIIRNWLNGREKQ